MPRSGAETRSHLLKVAGELFYAKGIRATGVDLVAVEAGVAPTTLYRQFASKDDLVGSYVEGVDLAFRDRFASAIAAAGAEPRDQIFAIFDDAIAQAAQDHFRGCPAQMALAEYPDPASSAHANAVTAKSWLLNSIAAVTERLDVDDSVALARQLFVVWEGMLASTMSMGSTGPAQQSRRIVEALLPGE
ncbi:TetR/AcrR family transcriptional regulator [Antrihabitans cavernicola]|uniref:TetR/AcrR family transcriptional regulator n=1 Tax=Antrihabitans cavernicola TaxID=2495913 RepID=A0A5A7S8C7_9NOCA|nr:TetR/AcrR family transcriptional regulator [Spelaeibacter cavernicola]KAA0021402.1 TetR/AcrR family transcriptional regulator [Spelaeibacter cavernicola]